MDRSDNPNVSSEGLDGRRGSSPRAQLPPVRTTMVILLGSVGVLLGGFAYLVAAIAIETFFEARQFTPTLSYGQQAALVSLPLCAVLGGCIGWSIALSYARRRWLAIAMLGVTSLVATMLVTTIWQSQVAEYGRDLSEIVLYYPPLAFCGLAATLAGLMSVTLFCASPLKNVRKEKETDE